MAGRSLNKVLLIGNLTRDPEVRYTANGAAVATFGLATNKSWKDANGEVKESTEFHNIVAWGKMAEICQQLLTKGMLVYIEGSLSTRNWEDDQGVTHYKTEVRVNDMILLNNKGKSVNTDMSPVEDVSETDDKEVEVATVDENKKDTKSKSEENSVDPLEDDLPF
jgi:single-strand DNA-binding protein